MDGFVEGASSDENAQPVTSIIFNDLQINISDSMLSRNPQSVLTGSIFSMHLRPLLGRLSGELDDWPLVYMQVLFVGRSKSMWCCLKCLLQDSCSTAHGPESFRTTSFVPGNMEVHNIDVSS